MSKFSMTIPSGTTRAFHTAGKYCDKDISITATGGDYGKGYQDGNAAGIEDGKRAQYDAFWDAYQQNGNRTDYAGSFYGKGWTDENFKPKYNITASVTDSLFQKNGITDLVKILEDCGVELDLSKAAEGTYLVNSCNSLTRLPVLDCRNRANINYFIIACSSLYSIEKVILKDDGTQTFNNYSFLGLPRLEEICFAGCIGNSLAIKDSPLLSDASVQSIIDCLKDLTGATAQTLTLHATVAGNMTAEQKAAITAKNWTLVY
jgi:hypothetical protein